MFATGRRAILVGTGGRVFLGGDLCRDGRLDALALSSGRLVLARNCAVARELAIVCGNSVR